MPTAVIALLVLLAGCSAPPPPVVAAPLDEHVTLEIRTNPLTLRLLRDGVVFVEAPRFVEIGVTSRDPALYVDPAAPKEVTFTVPSQALAWDGKTLTLEGGAKLTVGSRLVLEADAQLLRFVLPFSDEVYGLGELYDSPGSRGVVREMQLRLDVGSDAGTNEVHVPVPLALFADWGVFADEKRPGAFDVGAARSDVMLATFATKSLALQLYAGDALSVLDQYTKQTGRPKAPPAWALAPMQWRNEGTQADVLDDATQLRALGIPTGTLWIDNPWQSGYNTFQFDAARYPDPAQILSALTRQGFKLLVWSSPYVNATNDDHAEAAAQGLLVTDGHGRPYDWPWQNGPGALVDFTAPGATDFWRARLHRATDLGVAGFKLDFGEDLVPELGGRKTPFQLAKGGTDEWHAAYAGAYQAAYDAEFLITRAGTAGTQSITTCIWPGDLDNDFSRHTTKHSGGLPSAIAAAASLSASGFPFFASDIGGFRGGVPSTEALVRWTEAASILPLMQLGGGGKSHNPWDTTLFGPEALPIYARYARLHMDLLPYLQALVSQASQSGAPIVRAPGMMHRGHPYEDDFYVGEALFAAPVVEEGATARDVTLPPGEWLDWWSDAKVEGLQHVSAPLDTLPLWRKAGQMVPLYAQPLETLLPDPGVVPLRVLLAPRGAAHFALADGHVLDASDDGSAITLSTDHPDVEFDLDVDFVPSGASCGSCYSYAGGVAIVHLVGGGSAQLLR